MVHKRFITKGGKTFGPYYYESYRDKNGKIRKRYLKGYEPKRDDAGKGFENFKIKGFLVLLGIIALLLFAFAFFGERDSTFTGKAIDLGDGVYLPGEQLEGHININVLEGELIPVDSVFRVVLGDVEQRYVLSDYVDLDDSLSATGEFYAQGVELSGTGPGYGVPGKKEICPTIDFELEIYTEDSDDSGSSGGSDTGEEVSEGTGDSVEDGEEDVGDSDSEDGSSEGEEDDGSEEISEEEGSDESVEGDTDSEDLGDSGSDEDSSDSAESSDDSGDSGESDSGGDDSGDSGDSDSGSLITGEAISEGNSVSGSVACDGEWNYNLDEDEGARIVSVSVDGEEVSNLAIDLDVSEGEAVVSGDYVTYEEGFGEEYLTEVEAITFRISISDLELLATDDDLEVILEYDNMEIASYSEPIVVSEDALVFAEDNETGNESITEPTVALLQDIPITRIPFNGEAQIDLSEYFSGVEEYEIRVDDIRGEVSGEVLTLTPPTDFKGARKAVIIASTEEETLESNSFTILVSSGAVKLKTTRSQIKVGETVKVTREIVKDDPEDEFSVEIPAEAENLVIVEKDADENVIDTTEAEDIAGKTLLTGDVIIDVDLREPGFIQRVSYLIDRNLRNTLLIPLEKFLHNNFGWSIGITGKVVSDLAGNAEVVLDNPDAVTTEIEYDLPAPEAFETILDENTKEVVISGPDNAGIVYEDVLAFTEMDNVVSVNEIEKLQLYWIKEASETVSAAEVSKPSETNLEDEAVIVEDVTVTLDGEVIENNSTNSTKNDSSGNESSGGLITGNVISRNLDITGRVVDEPTETTVNYLRESMLFDAYDLDLDGMIDYIEWIVPHLSNQTFELVIVSANATANITEEATFSHLAISDSAPYDDLLAYWSFDGDTENTEGATHYDFTTNDHDGTGVGNAYVNSTDCLYGDCAQFDGVGDYINTSWEDLDFQNDNITVSLWVKIDSLVSGGTVFSQCSSGGGCDSGYGFDIEFVAGGGNVGKTSVQFSEFSSLTGTSALNDGNWHMVTVVVNGSQDWTDLYIDGSYDTGGSTSLDDPQVGGENVKIGGTPGWGFFNGSIDEVMVFNRTLTSSQVSDIYTNSSGRFRSAGEIEFENFGDLSSFTELDLTVTECETLLSSTIDGKVNDGSYQSLSSCAFSNYSLAGISGLNEANLTLRLNAGANYFYTPLAITNVSVTGLNDSTAPTVTFVDPTPANASTVDGGSVFVNVSSSDNYGEHYVFVEQNDDVLLWLRMDDVDGSGNPVDTSSYSNNGTRSGNAAQTSSGKFGAGFAFDGAGDYVQHTGGNSIEFDPNGTYTWSVWIYPVESGFNGLIGQGGGGIKNGWSSYITAGNDLSFTDGDTNELVSSSSVQINQWNHVVFTFDNGAIKGYLDSVEVIDGSHAFEEELVNFQFGRSAATGGTLDFNGTMDEIIILNRTLNVSEVAALYNASATQYIRNEFFESGEYTLKAHAVDLVGNVNVPEVRTFTTADLLAPTITIVVPANYSSWNTLSLDFNVSLSETGSWCGVSFDGGANVSMTEINTTYFNYANTSMDQGGTPFVVTCNDTSGNFGVSDEYTVFVDTVSPGILFVSPTPSDGSTQTVDNFVINVSSSDSNNHYTFVESDGDVLLWYGFDSLSGNNPVDQAGGTYNGTYIGTPTVDSDGAFGDAFTLDASDYINTTTPELNLTEGISVSMWVKTVNQSQQELYMACSDTGVCDSDGRIYASVSATGVVTFSNGEAFTVTGSDTIDDGAWHHVVMVYGEIVSSYSNSSLYVDGVLDGQINQDLTGYGVTVSTFMTFGGGNNAGGWGNTLDGSLDEVIVFTRALTVEEVGALYNASATPYENNFSGLSEDIHNFTGYAVDSEGNTNQTSLGVTVDLTTPTLAFTTATPSSGEILFSDSIYAAVSVSNVDSEDTITFNLYDAAGSVSNSSEFRDGTRAINWTGLSSGNYSFEVLLNETDGSTAGTGNVSVILLDSCLDLAGCSETGACVVDQSCALNNDLCTGNVCNFATLTLEAGKKVYTGYDSSNNGKDLTLNLDADGSTRSPLTSGTGSGIIANGRGGSGHGSGSRGGDGGDVNVTVDDLFNTTDTNLTARGGYSTASFTPGGDGGNVYLYYHGLIQKFTEGTADIHLAGGNSFSSLLGTDGGKNNDGATPFYNKDLTTFPLDVDVDDNGQITPFDYLLIRTNYNDLSTDEGGGYTTARDINGDLKLNVQDIARVGFELNTR